MNTRKNKSKLKPIKAPQRSPISKMALWLLLSSSMVHAEEYWLDTVDPEAISTGWGKAGLGLTVDGSPIVMGGRTFKKGLGTHAASKLALTLDGKAKSFSALVGISDSKKGTEACVEFKVIGDGATLWESGLIKAGMAPKPLQVNLTGIKKLELVVGDGGNSINHDHANWADAVIHYDGAIPTCGSDTVTLDTQNMKIRYNVDKKGILGVQSIMAGDPSYKFPFTGPVYPGKAGSKHYEAPVEITKDLGESFIQFVYKGHVRRKDPQGIEHVILTLQDALSPLVVEIHHKIYSKEDVIAQWAVVVNKTDQPVKVRRLESAFWMAPAGCQAHLEWYDSRWTGEASRPERERLTKGLRQLQSRGGHRHIDGAVPAFVMSFGGPVDENKTPCLIAALAWSGSMAMSFNIDSQNTLTTSLGMSFPNGEVTVEAGQSLMSPSCVTTYSSTGKGRASQNLHAWMRNYGMRDGHRLRLIDNNSWEGCLFNVNENTVEDMMKGSADLGIELYVLDDGWFGNGTHARTSDHSGLGDWQVNAQRFPSGLDKLIKKAETFGIKFGLWFEPEMINPRSELYAKHPEWILKNPGQELALQRQQAVLDLANPQVRDFVYASVADILSANPGIRFVKWDANSDINNPYSPYLGEKRQGALLVEYFKGYYDILKRLVEKFPDIDFQACSSGGGRADLGAMEFSHTFWLSDNTNPLYRLNAQWNFSTFLPAMAQTCHVTHTGNFKPKFRFDVSMMGQLGLELDPRRSEPEFKEACRTGIMAYKSVREIVQFGTQYRHRSPAESPTPSLNYVSQDKSQALVLAWQIGPIKGNEKALASVAGLDESSQYAVKEINLPTGDSIPRCGIRSGTAKSGKAWMAEGVPLEYSRQYDSAAIVLIKL